MEEPTMTNDTGHPAALACADAGESAWVAQTRNEPLSPDEAAAARKACAALSAKLRVRNRYAEACSEFASIISAISSNPLYSWSVYARGFEPDDPHGPEELLAALEETIDFVCFLMQPPTPEEIAEDEANGTFPREPLDDDVVLVVDGRIHVVIRNGPDGPVVTRLAPIDSERR
jgi:hypothetical protein